jgi:hypothetical protein
MHGYWTVLMKDKTNLFEFCLKDGLLESLSVRRALQLLVTKKVENK